MWRLISKSNAIWYVDATGSILKDKPNNKDVLLYSIVCYDREKENFIQVAEFFSGIKLKPLFSCLLKIM
jgi:hypothetical protein